MSQSAAEIGVSTDTVHRYKRAFAKMTAEERALLITALFDERWRELVRSDETWDVRGAVAMVRARMG